MICDKKSLRLHQVFSSINKIPFYNYLQLFYFMEFKKEKNTNKRRIKFILIFRKECPANRIIFQVRFPLLLKLLC